MEVWLVEKQWVFAGWLCFQQKKLGGVIHCVRLLPSPAAAQRAMAKDGNQTQFKAPSDGRQLIIILWPKMSYLSLDGKKCSSTN